MDSPTHENAGHLQLIHAVLPVFVQALPPVPDVAPTTNPKQEKLKNFITILRFEIQEMQQVLIETHVEQNLTNNDAFGEALEDLLFCLDALVDIKPESLSVCTF
jgi:hypothetical protein